MEANTAYTARGEHIMAPMAARGEFIKAYTGSRQISTASSDGGKEASTAYTARGKLIMAP